MTKWFVAIILIASISSAEAWTNLLATPTTGAGPLATAAYFAEYGLQVDLTDAAFQLAEPLLTTAVGSGSGGNTPPFGIYVGASGCNWFGIDKTDTGYGLVCNTTLSQVRLIQWDTTYFTAEIDGALGIFQGFTSAPSKAALFFGSDSTTGFYLAGSGAIGFTSGGTQTLQMDGNALTVKNILALPVQLEHITPGCNQAGYIAVTYQYIGCVCNGSSWVRLADGQTSCTF